MAPVWAGAVAAGPVVPVACAAADNLGIQVAVTEAPAGSVLVVHVDGHPDHGYWGEVLTVAAQARGLAGLVIDACVRDTAALQARAFPVFAAGIALPGTTKGGPGAVGRPVVVGGVEVTLDHVVVADEDGVVVIPSRSVDEVIAAGLARAEKEQRWFEALASGASVVEMLGIDDTGAVARP